MPLMEHLRELRGRLFKASLAILVGFIIGYAVHTRVLDFMVQPYCHLAIANRGSQGCDIITTQVTSYFVVGLKLALYIGLILACPVWLYQLWAFIAPGLHRNERSWAYGFVGVAVPLFAGGVVLAYLIVARGLEFLLPSVASQVKAMLDVAGYIDFMTKLMVVFGLALEFPLILALLNAAGILSAKRLLGWWRIAVFLMFAISAVVTPTPDPFGMTALAIPMVVLYFGAVGFAFLNDGRKARKLAADYGAVDDDEASELDYQSDPVDDLEPIGDPEPIESPDESSEDRADRRRRRFDDST